MLRKHVPILHHDGDIRSVTESAFFGIVRKRSSGDRRSGVSGFARVVSRVGSADAPLRLLSSRLCALSTIRFVVSQHGHGPPRGSHTRRGGAAVAWDLHCDPVPWPRLWHLHRHLIAIVSLAAQPASTPRASDPFIVAFDVVEDERWWWSGCPLCLGLLQEFRQAHVLVGIDFGTIVAFAVLVGGGNNAIHTP